MGDSGSMFIRFLSRQCRAGKCFRRTVAQFVAGIGGSYSRALHSHFRHDVCHDPAQVLGARRVYRRPRSYFHRLVALGMSERHAVWMLYGFAALSGVLALLVQRVKLDVSLAAIAGFTVLLTLIGVYLAGVKVL